MIPTVSVGVLLSIGAAGLKSVKDITTKVGAENADEYITSLSTRLFALPVFAVALVLVGQFRIPTNTTFWVALLVNISLLTLTTILIAKAYRVSDISIIAPLMSFVPVMTVLPAWILLGEVPSPLAGGGIVLVSVGAYVLGVQSTAEGVLSPIKNLTTDRGAQYIVVMLLLVGVVPSVDKIGLQNSSPLLWVLATHLGMSFMLGGIAFTKSRTTAKTDFSNNRLVLVTLGVVNAVLWIAQINAYAVFPVAYVQAIKRGGIVLSIVAGYYIFNEEHIRKRLIGGTIIIVGVAAVIFGT